METHDNQGAGGREPGCALRLAKKLRSCAREGAEHLVLRQWGGGGRASSVKVVVAKFELLLWRRGHAACRTFLEFNSVFLFRCHVRMIT